MCFSWFSFAVHKYLCSELPLFTPHSFLRSSSISCFLVVLIRFSFSIFLLLLSRIKENRKAMKKNSGEEERRNGQFRFISLSSSNLVCLSVCIFNTLLLFGYRMERLSQIYYRLMIYLYRL